jgi:hypothetical protein
MRAVSTTYSVLGDAPHGCSQTKVSGAAVVGVPTHRPLLARCRRHDR